MMARSFTKVFRTLNYDAGGTLFDIEGDLVIPKDKRVRLIMADVLGISKPFVDICPPASGRGLSEMTKTYETENILVHHFRTAPEYDRLSNRIRHLGEGLGVLVSTLYLRARGYMIGVGSYGTVNDVVAWKSPVLDELRDHGVIAQGCTITEVKRLRWLPGVRKPSSASNDACELTLVEAERSRADGLSNTETKGLNQLRKAWRENVATGLYICFPLSGTDDESPASVRTAIDSKWGREPTIGSILFDENGLYVCDSDSMTAPQCDSEIRRLEKQLKKALLANFSFGEILTFAKTLDIDIKGKRLEDIGQVLKDEIADRAGIAVILDNLKQVMKEEA